MAVKYVKVKEGHKFQLTPLGIEQPKVRAKYEVETPLKKRYEVSAPSSWIEKGWIVEVKC